MLSVKKKMQNINLQFLIQIETIKQERIGGGFLDIHAFVFI